MSETELIGRVERLERDNRRLKSLGIVAVVIVAALGTMAATRPVPQKIVAHEFDVVDGQGRTRAVLHVGSIPLDDTSLTFLDAGGRKRVVLVGGTGPVGNTYAWLELGEDAASEHPVLTSAGGHGGVTLSDGGLTMNAFPPREEGGSVLLQGPGPNGPALELADSQGYVLDLGRTETVIPATGQTQQTSAASIVMFGNDKKHHVIWQAPR